MYDWKGELIPFPEQTEAISFGTLWEARIRARCLQRGLFSAHSFIKQALRTAAFCLACAFHKYRLPSDVRVTSGHELDFKSPCVPGSRSTILPVREQVGIGSESCTVRALAFTLCSVLCCCLFHVRRPAKLWRALLLYGHQRVGGSVNEFT